MNELAQHLDFLPSFDNPIVAYCGSGWRATIAMNALYDMGWTNVRALKTPLVNIVAAGFPIVPGLPEIMELNVAQPVGGLVTAVDPTLIALKDKAWDGIAPDALNASLAENPNLILIDVRTPEELTKNGVIAVVDQELLSIPLESFIADKSMWPTDKNAEIVVHCGSGHRSTMAITILLSNGYINVTSLKGGFGGWVDASLPVAESMAP